MSVDSFENFKITCEKQMMKSVEWVMVFMYLLSSNPTVGKDHFNSVSFNPSFQISYQIENFQSMTRNCPRVDRENDMNA